MALLGIDGIGKTTVANYLVDRLRERGSPAELVSWRALLRRDWGNGRYPRDALEELWVEDWRLLYGGALDSVQTIPRTYGDFAGLDVEQTFPTFSAEVRPAGPLVSALVEHAVDYLIEEEVVRGAVASDTAVVRESYGYKPVLKSLLIARRAAEGSPLRAAVDRAVDRVRHAYGDPYLQPDVGIYLDGSPETAMSRLAAGDRRIGPGEDYGLAGIGGPESYRALQADCRAEFLRVADDWGWTVVPADERPAEEVCREAWAAVAARLGPDPEPGNPQKDLAGGRGA